MESPVQPTTPELASMSEKEEKVPKKHKNARFKWWQALLLLIGTLAISVSAGYYISNKYFWNSNNEQLDKQLSYYKIQVDQKPNDSKLRVQLGYTYFLKGDNDKALNEFNTAKNLDKTNFDAYLNLAIVYDKQNKNDEALQMAIKSTKLAPRDYKGHLLAGRSYRKLKMYPKAESELQEAIRLKPGNTDILYEVGQVAEAQGKKADAEKIYKETLSYDPTFKPAISALDRLKSKN